MKKRKVDRAAQREQQLKQILAYIEQYIEREGRSPSFEDIADGTYMTRSNVVRYIDWLEGRGYIKRVPGVPRSISLVKRSDRL